MWPLPLAAGLVASELPSLLGMDVFCPSQECHVLGEEGLQEDFYKRGREQVVNDGSLSSRYALVPDYVNIDVGLQTFQCRPRSQSCATSPKREQPTAEDHGLMKNVGKRSPLPCAQGHTSGGCNSGTQRCSRRPGVHSRSSEPHSVHQVPRVYAYMRGSARQQVERAYTVTYGIPAENTTLQIKCAAGMFTISRIAWRRGF